MVVPLPKKKKNVLKLFIEISLVMHTNNTAYQFLVHESHISDIHKNTIMESRNASFFENLFLCKSKEDQSS